jgi:hypothetical protein
VVLGGELDTTRGRRSMGGLASAQISYKPWDGVDFTVGYAIAGGQDRVTLEVFEPLDQVYLKVRADF